MELILLQPPGEYDLLVHSDLSQDEIERLVAELERRGRIVKQVYQQDTSGE